jgi:hypothetical protein
LLPGLRLVPFEQMSLRASELKGHFSESGGQGVGDQVDPFILV